MSKSVTVSTHLEAPPDLVWDVMQSPRLLRFVAAPLVRFHPKAGAAWPEVFEPGAYEVRMRLYGVVPLGSQTIDISFPEAPPGGRAVRDNGHSALIRRWDHLIEIVPEGTGTRYTDRVEIEAGWLTAPVAAFARLFFAHRQRRWRRLVAAGFDYSAA